jgi:hypothetical protein
MIPKNAPRCLEKSSEGPLLSPEPARLPTVTRVVPPEPTPFWPLYPSKTLPFRSGKE